MAEKITGRTLLNLWLLEVLGLGMGARWDFVAPGGEANPAAAILGSFFLLCLVLLTFVTLAWFRRMSGHGA